MTVFTGINLDPNVQENSGEFTVLPAGKYKACIVNDELKDNRAGNGKVLSLKVQIMEGQFAQEILTDYINIINPNATAQAIGQGTLRRICNLCRVQYPPQDTMGLMGKPMAITVAVEEFTSNNTGNVLKSNKIKKYDPVSEMATTTPAPAPVQPEQNNLQPANAW